MSTYRVVAPTELGPVRSCPLVSVPAVGHGRLPLVKIWKASPMSYLVVREGSNRISLPLSRTAHFFFSFRWWVRVRWSFGGWIVWSYLGSMRPESSHAMVAHRWGVVQPHFRSRLQYRQVHLFFFWRSCGVLWSVRCLAIFKRLRMVVA